MARPRKATPAPRAARDRTAGELVRYLRGRPSTPGMSHETALSVAGSWRRLLQQVGPVGWETTALGDLEVNSLLAAYEAQGLVSGATVASMRSRLPKGLRVFEDSLRGVVTHEGRGGGGPVVASLVLRPDWTFDLRLPADCTARELRLVGGLLGLFTGPDGPAGVGQVASLRLRPDWEFTLTLPADFTARELGRIRGLVALHAPDGPDGPDGP